MLPNSGAVQSIAASPKTQLSAIVYDDESIRVVFLDVVKSIDTPNS